MFPGFIHHKPAGLVILSQPPPLMLWTEMQNAADTHTHKKSRQISLKKIVRWITPPPPLHHSSAFSSSSLSSG